MIPSRSRKHRPNPLEGLSALGGGNATVVSSIVVVLLIVLGLTVIVKGRTLRAEDLHAVGVKVWRKPYEGNFRKVNKVVYIPVSEGGHDLWVQDFALQATSPAILKQQIAEGDSLQVWVDDENFSTLNNAESRKPAFVKLLKKGDDWLISEADYNQVLGHDSKTGWWVLALGLSMIPYFFVERPRIKAAWTFGAIILVAIVWMWVTS